MSPDVEHKQTPDSGPEPRPSASIILIRDGDQGVELFVVRRNANMRFAPGATAFPGGALDKQDRDFANAINPQDDILPFRINAIRELFEETGLLLARNKHGELLNRSEALALFHYREPLVNDVLSFEAFVQKESLQLNLDSLVHFARWVAPAVVKPRFATDFFLAPQPGDQHSEPDTGELDAAHWVPLQTLMSQVESREVKMVFPTEMNCLRLMQQPNVNEIMAAATQPAPIIRTVSEETDEGIFLCTPPEAGVGFHRRKFRG